MKRKEEYYIQLAKKGIEVFKNNNFTVHQIKKQNCWASEIFTVNMDNLAWDCIILISYSTIVGAYIPQVGAFVEFGKYSTTTSKQVTQFCNSREVTMRIFVDKGV